MLRSCCIKYTHCACCTASPEWKCILKINESMKCGLFSPTDCAADSPPGPHPARHLWLHHPIPHPGSFVWMSPGQTTHPEHLPAWSRSQLHRTRRESQPGTIIFIFFNWNIYRAKGNHTEYSLCILGCCCAFQQRIYIGGWVQQY